MNYILESSSYKHRNGWYTVHRQNLQRYWHFFSQDGQNPLLLITLFKRVIKRAISYSTPFFTHTPFLPRYLKPGNSSISNNDFVGQKHISYQPQKLFFGKYLLTDFMLDIAQLFEVGDVSKRTSFIYFKSHACPSYKSWSVLRLEISYSQNSSLDCVQS